MSRPKTEPAYEILKLCEELGRSRFVYQLGSVDFSNGYRIDHIFHWTNCQVDM